MFPFQNARWIFADTDPTPDLYTDYRQTFSYLSGDAVLYISVDTDYTLYLNGQYVASNQYGDFEHYKIYDTLSLTPFLHEGENTLDLTVYYCGADFQRYKRGVAGVLFEVFVDGETVVASGTHTLSRKNPAYKSGECRIVSRQLGYTFHYDATRENDEGFLPSVEVDKPSRLLPRPTRKLCVCHPKEILQTTKTDTGTLLIDFGEETVGLVTLRFSSPTEQTVTVAYGESLTDGHVRMQIHNRNFFFEYRARAGDNHFTNYMLRLGCRYLEVETEEAIDVEYIGILPQVYPIPSREDVLIEGDVESDIYSICVHTLRLCMMEHYVDTPWREQCLYAFDARNQMLSGYRIFENGNALYARSNLALLSEDRREDGLLSICAPCGTTLAIPSFSLYYIIAMYEYAREVEDFTLAHEYRKKVESILDVFLKQRDAMGLVRAFGEKDKWNFYDWSPYLNGNLYQSSDTQPDLILNTLFLLALDAYEKLYEGEGISPRFCGVAEALRQAIRVAFRTEDGAYTHLPGTKQFTSLGNALAILSHIPTEEEAHALAYRLASGEFSKASISMNIWIYDALIETDTDRYREFILADIRRRYEKMIPSGTVWETEDGDLAFDGAGSLCHGWSAVPIYIYHRLGVARYETETSPPCPCR